MTDSMRIRGRLAGGLALLALATCTTSAAAADAPTRYSLAGGCYALTSASTGRSSRAATSCGCRRRRLGSYLLYRPDARLPRRAATTAASVPRRSRARRPTGRSSRRAATRSRSRPRRHPTSVLAVSGAAAMAAWRHGGGAGARRSSRSCRRAAAPTTPRPSSTPRARRRRAALPFGEVGGLIDGHMHWMTFEYLGGNFHCGRPWDAVRDPVRAARLLGDRGPAGHARRRSRTSSTSAAPTQPARHDGLAEAHRVGTPTTSPTRAPTGAGSQRAWMGGLRLIVMPVNENRILCELHDQPPQLVRRDGHRAQRASTTCNELQDYVDAQAGGPGKGFFQIVTDPFEARQGDQRGQDGGRPRDRGLRAVRLPGLGPARRATRRRSTASSTSSTTAACARRCCSTSSTTRSRASASTAGRSAR